MKMTESRQSAFTLVELLVAMAIFAVILTAVLRVFRTNYKSYALQNEVVELQQNIRVAKMFVERDVRMAGAGLRGFSYNSSSGGGPLPVYAFNFIDGGTGDTDQLTVYYIDYEIDTCANAPPQLTLKGSMPTSSAEAKVNEKLNVSPYDQWVSSFDCDDTTYGNVSAGGFVPFQAIITSPDGLQSSVLWITTTQVGGGGTESKLQNHRYPAGSSCSGSETDSSCNKVLNDFPENSRINFFSSNALRRIDYRVSGNLFQRSSQPYDQGSVFSTVAENIEDFQCAFDLDTDGDGTVDTWINNQNLTSAQLGEVRRVRITLRGRTAEPVNPGAGNANWTIEDHAHTGNPPDRYERRQLTVTVVVRNLAL